MGKPNERRRVSIRTIRRDPPDLRKLSKALIALAMAQAQAEAEAKSEQDKQKQDRGKRR